MKKDKFYEELGALLSEVHDNGLNATAFLENAFDMYRMTKGARAPKENTKDGIMDAIHWKKRREFLDFLAREFDRYKLK